MAPYMMIVYLLRDMNENLHALYASEQSWTYL